VKYQPNRKMNFTAMLEHQLLDDNVATMGKKFRQDWGAWLIALVHPEPRVRLRGRVRYLDESSELLGGGKDDNLERSMAVSVDAAFGIRQKDTVRLRADGKFYFDDRMSTMDRDPKRDLVFWLQYEARL
jgi:hypothetical protein